MLEVRRMRRVGDARRGDPQVLGDSSRVEAKGCHRRGTQRALRGRVRGLEPPTSTVVPPRRALGWVRGVYGRLRHSLHPRHPRRCPAPPSPGRHQLHGVPHRRRMGPERRARLSLATHQHCCNTLLDRRRTRSLPRHARRALQPRPCAHTLFLLFVSRNHRAYNLFQLAHIECPAHRRRILERRWRRFYLFCRWFCRWHPCLCRLVPCALLW